MPFMGIMMGGINFTDLKLSVGESIIMYGVFIQNVMDFFLISLVIFITIRLYKKIERKEEAKAVAKIDQKVELLREIRDLLKNPQNNMN